MVDEERPKSFVLALFEDIGSTVIQQIQIEGLTPLQLIALAAYLELRGKNELIKQENEREEQARQQRLSVPRDKIVIANR